MKVFATFWIICCCTFATAQRPSPQPTPETPAQRTQEIQQLRLELQTISARLDVLEREESAATPSTPATPVASTPPPQSTTPPPATLTAEDRSTLKFLRGTTFNFALDGYYAYNFNQPIGRVNQLRAYDVSSNSFSINQANFIVEHLPAASADERFGGRIDLQFGQATETLQGSSANELRPQVWRNLFQAYGSYLAPVGTGLQFDFGKWASALGVEGNYTKDQINYSRSYLFNYLPFYHTGLRANYNLTPRINVAYWLINGVQQTEDFNGFKSQAFIFTFKPASTITWNVNYYFGEEQPDVVPSPTDGLPTQNITPAPNGREHIFDTYATWNATPRLTLVGEADFVINRVFSYSQPKHVAAGAFYVKYALPHNYNIAARTEYFDDRGGLFSGAMQALNELTLTFDRQIEPGFLARAEYRRDAANQPFFLTNTVSNLSHTQSTATIGLVFWWGQKQGSW
ncbi:MAG: outer membrane beta-barrel protein [Acidobacteriaceae bacterium]